MSVSSFRCQMPITDHILPAATVVLLVSTLWLYGQNRNLRLLMREAGMGEVRDGFREHHMMPEVDDSSDEHAHYDHTNHHDAYHVESPRGFAVGADSQHHADAHPQTGDVGRSEIQSFYAGVAGEIDNETMQKLDAAVADREQKIQEGKKNV